MRDGSGTSKRSSLERAASSRSGRNTLVTRRAAAGEVIVHQGDDDAAMFIIQSGRVEIRRAQGDQQFALGILEQGDFFGEMSLLESLPRSATAVALEPTVLLELGVGALLYRIRRDPTLAVEMLQKLSARLRTVQDKLAVRDPTVVDDTVDA